MSGGHWEYLSCKIEERIGLDNAWRLLAAIEHVLDWGICCDTCERCAEIRTINALKAYFDTDATDVDDALQLLKSSQPVCQKCKDRETKRKSMTVECAYEGTVYKGTLYAMREDKP